MKTAMAKYTDPDKPKKRRVEGFIHQKIDPNMQKALDFLSKSWGVPVQDVPGRAIQSAATDEALTREMKDLKAQPTKKRKQQHESPVSAEQQQKLRHENDRLAAELQGASQRVATLEEQHAKLRAELTGLLARLDTKT